MTNYEYAVKYNLSQDSLISMFKMSKIKNMEVFLKSKYEWNPEYKVGDILIFNYDRAIIVVGTNDEKMEYIAIDAISMEDYVTDDECGIDVSKFDRDDTLYRIGSVDSDTLNTLKRRIASQKK